MLRFQHIEYLWLLVAVAALLLLYIYHRNWRKNKLAKTGDPILVAALMPSYNPTRKLLRYLLTCAVLFCGILALANLQSGARSQKVTRKGIDLMIALDVSKSMLARDVSPNRLDRSRQFILKLLEKLNNNRIGLIVFAGRSYVSVPLTIDMAALRMNLGSATPDMVPTQGTVISEAIRMARESFNTRETKYKSIVLISDGEDHDESALKETKKSVEEGIMINTVGVGSTQGSPIWDEDIKGNKTDENGNEIISKLNEEILQQIAQEGQGVYRHLQNTESAADAIARQVNSIEQKNFGDSLFVDYNSFFQYFLGIALLLFLVDYFLPEQKKVATA